MLRNQFLVLFVFILIVDDYRHAYPYKNRNFRAEIPKRNTLFFDGTSPTDCASFTESQIRSSLVLKSRKGRPAPDKYRTELFPPKSDTVWVCVCVCVCIKSGNEKGKRRGLRGHNRFMNMYGGDTCALARWLSPIWTSKNPHATRSLSIWWIFGVDADEQRRWGFNLLARWWPSRNNNSDFRFLWLERILFGLPCYVR